MDWKDIKMNKDAKVLIIRAFKLLHFAGCLILFALAWHLYREHYHIRFASRYELFVLGMYAFALLFFLRTYSAYMIDYNLPGDLTFSLSLSCFFSAAFVYGITRFLPARCTTGCINRCARRSSSGMRTICSAWWISTVSPSASRWRST